MVISNAIQIMLTTSKMSNVIFIVVLIIAELTRYQKVKVDNDQEMAQ